MDEDKDFDEVAKEQLKKQIEEEVFWISDYIAALFVEAETEEETQQICNALCRMITLIKEKKNIDIDIDKIGKEITEVLMHDK